MPEAYDDSEQYSSAFHDRTAVRYTAADQPS
jgi:hypothetical protein